MEKKVLLLPNFFLCVILDIIGMASYVLPGLAEFGDVIWAPLSAFIFYKMFGGKMGVFGGAFSFLEEILPFTDVIPTFTIAWLIRYSAFNKMINATEKHSSH